MAKAGDEIVISQDERIRFTRTAEDTDGELLEVEVTYRPRSSRPPEHYHPYQEERFEVLSGRIRAKIGDAEWCLSRDGKIKESGPNVLQAAVLLGEYSEEFRPTKPSYAVQRVFVTLLAPLGRLLGYQARYLKALDLIIRS